jgi:hypothetical protein
MSVHSYKSSRFFSKKSFRAPDPPKEHTPLPVAFFKKNPDVKLSPKPLKEHKPTPSPPLPVDFFKRNSEVKLPPKPPKVHTPTPPPPLPVDFFSKAPDVKLPSKPSADLLQKKTTDPRSKSWEDVMKELTEQSNRIKQRRQANINGKGDSFSFN